MRQVNYYPADDLVFFENDLVMAATGGNLVAINVNDQGNSKIILTDTAYLFYELSNLAVNCSQQTLLAFGFHPSQCNAAE